MTFGILGRCKATRAAGRKLSSRTTMDDTTGVYNSTTISYENPGGVSMGGGGGGQRRAWNLSEIVNPPVARSRWFHWILLMGGSIVLGLGLIVVVIGIYNQHYYDPESHNVKMGDGK